MDAYINKGMSISNTASEGKINSISRCLIK